MAPRILLAEDGKAVVAAVERGAAATGAEGAAGPLPGAAGRLGADHAAAIVRGTEEGRAVVEQLRAADPDLPVVALFYDDDEALQAGPGVLGADGALVGPLTLASVAGTVRLALRLREARRAAAPPSPFDGPADAALPRPTPVPAAPPPPEPEPPEALRQPALTPVPAGGDNGLELLKRLIVLEVKRSRRYKLPVSIAIVALDGWPERATTLSPGERASTLSSVLATIAGALRDIDMVVPFPDDRIVALLPHTDRAGALVVAGRVVSRIRNLAGPIALTSSAGIATHDGEGDGAVSFASLVKRAAEALTRARAAGGNQAVAGDPPKRRQRILIG